MAPIAEVLAPQQAPASNPAHYDANVYFENIKTHSGPQGKVEPITIIDDPADWRAKDLKPEDYTYRLSRSEVAEIIAGTDAILARSDNWDEEDIKKLTRDDFIPHWPNVTARFRELADNVSNGRGFQVIKGFLVDHYKANRSGLVVAYWGVGLVIGRPLVSQTDKTSNGEVFGSLLNHITVGRHADVYIEPNSYTKANDSSFLNFHSDQGATDIISLLSINAAKEGGESLVVSSIAIHNELLHRGRKDLVEVLSTPGIWWTATQTDQRQAVPNADGKFDRFEETQPFEYHQGYLTVHYSARKYFNTGKDLTPLQKEAIWTVAAIAEEPGVALSIKLEPGDIEWIHNPSTFHARTKVVDGENRHLLRWWVHTDGNKRPIAPHYAPRSNVGPEGGFQVPHYSDLSKQRLPLYPYSRHDGLGQSHVE